MLKIVFVAGICSLILGNVAQSAEGESGKANIRKGLDWLMAQQAADGGWHSETYGAMRGGAALTSLVLYTASLLPEEVSEDHHAALRRGWAFLAPGLRGTGSVSTADGESDFPTYAAAMLLGAVNSLDLGEEPEDVEALALFLCRVQLTEADGFELDDLDYGGWDMMGEVKRGGKTTGTSISVSRYAIEALRPHREIKAVATALERAENWIGGLQNILTDGGFHFHPDVEHLGNKAGWKRGDSVLARSYGTATADGLVALSFLVSGAEDDRKLTARTERAAGWIEVNGGVDSVPGFEFDPPEKGWGEGLRYYYMFALSAAIPLISEEVAVERTDEILKILMAGQTEAGFWKNESARMREDDPLIATCFALAALGRLVER